MGKCDALISRSNSSYFPPSPHSNVGFKKRPKACTVFCIILSTFIWEGGGGEDGGGDGPIYFVSECQMMLLSKSVTGVSQQFCNLL